MSRLPALTSKKMVKIFKKQGFEERRQKGSHLILKHPNGRRLVIPMHDRDLKRPTMMSIIKAAGLTEDEFRELL